MERQRQEGVERFPHQEQRKIRSGRREKMWELHAVREQGDRQRHMKKQTAVRARALPQGQLRGAKAQAATQQRKKNR